MKAHVEHIYDVIVTECGGLDAIYEDYIIKLVGEYGLTELKKHQMLEACGVVNGRQLYVLVIGK